MKKLLVTLSAVILLSGCATITDTINKYWPRSHDPVMFQQLVKLDISVDKVNCEAPAWGESIVLAGELERYTKWRKDPQHVNIEGLQKHLDKLNTNNNPTFCKLGKKTASLRIQATKKAWEGR